MTRCDETSRDETSRDETSRDKTSRDETSRDETSRDETALPVCSRCGSPQPPPGPLQTSDGTPISRSTYLALAGLVGDALVCLDCLPSSDVHGSDDAMPG